MRLAVVSGYVAAKGNALPDHVVRVRANHSIYCQRCGYDYFFRTDSVDVPSKDESGFYRGASVKPFYLLDLLQKGYEYVYWIDSDSVFTSSRELRVTGWPLEVCGDDNDLVNTGHILVRNCTEARAFLKEWIAVMQIKFAEDNESRCEVPFSLTADGYALSDQSVVNCLLGSESNERVELLKGFSMMNGFHLTDEVKKRRFEEESIEERLNRVSSRFRLSIGLGEQSIAIRHLSRLINRAYSFLATFWL